ncbi:MAG: hypothetical protein ABJ084_11140 [Halioglobus sp.]
MNQEQSFLGGRQRYQLFTALKYLVYALLCVNIYLFLQEELGALEHTFTQDIAPGQLIQVFSATIDTGAWVILLLLFELETSVLDDSKIYGVVKWILHGVRGICYVAVGYAFTGYYAELVTLYQTSLLGAADLCSSTYQGWSYLIDIDEYLPLTSEDCGAITGEIVRISQFNIVADSETLQSARYLAWVDVFNSAAWILVVIVLEVEVRLQLRGALSNQIMKINKWVKLVIYATLFLAAAYWGYAGDFLDFWDASLWLFAFIFIELNVFEWQHETSQVPEYS